MVVLASDHGGFELKEKIKQYLSAPDLNYELKETFGGEIFDAGCSAPADADFPMYAAEGVKKIQETGGIGIFVCGSGIGICMAANRYKGIRAAVCHNTEYARLSREHNNANVLCLGGRQINWSEAEQIVNTFLKARFLGGQYHKRNEMLDQ